MSADGIRGSSDRSILVLTSLAGNPKHGYALIKDIEEFAGVKMGPGTLYGCLAKLEDRLHIHWWLDARRLLRHSFPYRLQIRRSPVSYFRLFLPLWVPRRIDFARPCVEPRIPDRGLEHTRQAGDAQSIHVDHAKANVALRPGGDQIVVRGFRFAVVIA